MSVESPESRALPTSYTHVDDYLLLGQRAGASDIHLGVNAPPIWRLLPLCRLRQQAASTPAGYHAAGTSAQGIMTARASRWPPALMLKPRKAGVESSVTLSCPTCSTSMACTTMT